MQKAGKKSEKTASDQSICVKLLSSDLPSDEPIETKGPAEVLVDSVF